MAEAFKPIDPRLMSRIVNARLGAGTHEDRMKTYRAIPPESEIGSTVDLLKQADEMAAQIEDMRAKRREPVRYPITKEQVAP